MSARRGGRRAGIVSTRRSLPSLLVALVFAVQANGASEETKTAPAVPEITNADAIAKAMKLEQFKDKPFTRKLKVAVLDLGFNGHQVEIGSSLPSTTQYRSGAESEADKQTVTSYHGILMAKILVDLLKASGAKTDYDLHLFFAYGHTKFADAVEKVVNENFDIVLYAQIWEWGGNGDGRGFINAEVDKAVKAGVIWINAAGNYGNLTRTAPVDGKVEGGTEWVVFKPEKGKPTDGVTIYCRAPAKQECPLKVYLTWNDYKDDTKIGTDKDLDFFLFDSKLKQLAASELLQTSDMSKNGDTISHIPRELIEKKLAAGTYKLKVKIKSKNFSASQDRLRIAVGGKGMQLDQPSVGETLFPPADNPGVIAVGAKDDPASSESKSSKRPDVRLVSLVKLKDGTNVGSTSTAAAMAAAKAVLLLGTGTEKTREAVLTKLKEDTEVAAKKPAPEKKKVAERETPPTPAATPAPAPAKAKTPRIASAPPRRRVGEPREGPPPPARADIPPPDYPSNRRGAPPAPYRGSGIAEPGDEGPEIMPAPEGYPPRGLPPPGPPPPRAACLRVIPIPFDYPALSWVLGQGGGVPVVYHGRPAVFVPYDFAVHAHMPPRPPQTKIFVTPQGPRYVPTAQLQMGLPPEFVEVVRTNIPVCGE